MNELGNKIYNYLIGDYLMRTNMSDVAHDIAEIVEKHYAHNLGFTALLKENTELKDKLFRRNKRVEVLEQQLDNVKFLNRDEVEKIINSLVNDYADSIVRKKLLTKPLYEYITAICKLAIDRDRIINGLYRFMQYVIVNCEPGLIKQEWKDKINRIASEILNNMT